MGRKYLKLFQIIFKLSFKLFLNYFLKLKEDEYTDFISEIAKKFKCSESTVYKKVPNLKNQVHELIFEKI